MTRKAVRQDAILRIISTYQIDTQEALCARLCHEGIYATQATLSRDIRELKLLKVMTPKGTYRYEAPGLKGASAIKFNSSVTEAITSVQVAGSMLVIHTCAGMAQAVAACLDNARMENYLGCVAGDDTIFAAAKSPHSATLLANSIRDLIHTY